MKALTIRGYHGNMAQHYRLIVWERPLTTWWSWGSNLNGNKMDMYISLQIIQTHMKWYEHYTEMTHQSVLYLFNNAHVDNDSFIAWTTVSCGFFLRLPFQYVVWRNKRWANKNFHWLLSLPALHWANVASKRNDQQHRTAAGIFWITSYCSKQLKEH